MPETTPGAPAGATRASVERRATDAFAAADETRSVGPFVSAKRRRRYYAILIGLAVLAVLITIGLLGWDNKQEFLTEKWWRVAKMRVTAVVVILVVTFCQAFGTVAFQTATNNRIITPSIIGFESMYVLVQTSVVYFFGVTGLSGMSNIGTFVLQVSVMVLFAVLLYSWLLSGRFGNLHVMLLVGIVLGGGMGAISSFMQRMLDPNEFDILSAKMFGNVSNADTDNFIVVIPVCALVGLSIWLLAPRLNVIGLGADISANLGLNHKRQVMLMLTLVAILMAMSTSLVGPLTFLGFLSATLAYSLVDSYDHRRILPVAWLVGYCMLAGAYFLLRHVLTLVDAVGIIIELIGGGVFLIVVLRKGRL
ncbi:iron chelate uptake ABC transporter family permease subunit [Gulosibacter sp. 10]|uniref:iron chelate uptake ABC transporter family permease subunit n=1 Tax=Gulosibacter sp. 10 TaxID=1255570 RepID=UPI00097EAA20|nr:iron chelate uptake ABC transporter family permease subunit [Gulosibacter sp. 10]SJM58376.1 Petrobactin ABC transporter, permease protein II [Gulosibacter sp. 10]